MIISSNLHMSLTKVIRISWFATKTNFVLLTRSFNVVFYGYFDLFKDVGRILPVFSCIIFCDMVRLINNHQVVNSIITPDPINVMHDLIRFKFSVKELFHYMSVQKDPLASNILSNITSRTDNRLIPVKSFLGWFKRLIFIPMHSMFTTKSTTMLNHHNVITARSFTDVTKHISIINSIH